MADVTSIYGNPIKDAVARADIATNTQDISDLKDGLLHVYVEGTSLIINGGIPSGEDVSY